MTKTQDILNSFRIMVDDTPDSTEELELLNSAKDEVEEERDWEFLKKVDSTQSVVSGDTYLTAKTLPSDFRRPLRSGIYVGADIIPYFQVPFELRDQLQDTANHRYYLDLANSNFFIMGKPAAAAIKFWYLRTSPTLSTSQNPLFPSRFWPMLAYKMAMIWYAEDQGDKFRAWDDRWQVHYSSLFSRMVAWDEKIQRDAVQNVAERGLDYSRLPNVLSL